MKKRSNNILIFIMLLIVNFLLPKSINALDFNPKLYCDGTVLKGKEATCNIKVDINSYKLKSYEVEITLSDNLNTQTATISGSQLDEGAGKTLASFKVDGKDEGTGNVSVKIKNIVALVNDQEEAIDDIDIAASSIKVIEENNNLKSLTVEGKTVSNFSKDTLNYNVTTTKSSVKVAAQAESIDAKVTGTGDKKLICGNNSVDVSVNNNKTYNINITRECKSDAKLKKLTVSNGVLDPSFKENVTAYSVTVSKEIEKITIGHDKKDKTQTVTGSGIKNLEFGTNTFKITSKAEDGTTMTYTLTVIREDGRSTNNYLSNLELSEGNISFDKEMLNYELKVLYDTTKIEVIATKEDTNAKVKITGNENLKVGENKVVVKVTSEMGEERDYIVNVTRLKEGETLGDNPNIESIIVEGYSLGFSPNKQNYTLKIKEETSLKISIVMEDESATYEIEGNEELKNGSIITINTTSLDGSTNIYHINIEKDNFLPLILIMTAICLLVILVLIIVLIKLKKKKRKISKVKPDNIIEKDLLAKIDRQLKNAPTNIEKEIKEKKQPEIKEQVKNAREIKEQNKIKEENEIIIEKEQTFVPKQEIIEEPIKKEIPVEPKNINTFNNLRMQQADEIELPKETLNYNREENIKPYQGNYQIYQNNNYNVEEEREETKICSICGHRIPAATKVCPYCKRSF